eukprot:1161667-Pelagomonas_calceolata.AAC.7
MVTDHTKGAHVRTKGGVGKQVRFRKDVITDPFQCAHLTCWWTQHAGGQHAGGQCAQASHSDCHSVVLYRSHSVTATSIATSRSHSVTATSSVTSRSHSVTATSSATSRSYQQCLPTAMHKEAG